MNQKIPGNGGISLSLMQEIARRTQASFDRALKDAAEAKSQSTSSKLVDVVKVVDAVANIQQEFALVKACREFVKGVASKISEKTQADYRKKAKRLDQWRPDSDSPPDLLRCPSANSYYPYRAAAVWTAREECREALRQRDKLPAGSPERREVMRRLRRSLLTLETYPVGEQNITRFKQREAAAQLGLESIPTSCPLGRRNPRASKAKVASKLLRTHPDWANRIWARMEAVASPWQDQVAVMALTGCRPQEVFGVKIELNADGALVFLIQGAKVDDHKGQPWRRLTVNAERPEFTHLVERIGRAGSMTLPAHAELADPADALCSAVRRAGAQALGEETGFSAYVYRHAMAADLKADKLDREDIALALGHSVTETSSLYGFWQGGIAGVRQVVAEAARVVKVNHRHGKVAALTSPEPSPMPSSQSLPHPPAWRGDAPTSEHLASPDHDEPKPY
jgi:integrase